MTGEPIRHGAPWAAQKWRDELDRLDSIKAMQARMAEAFIPEEPLMPPHPDMHQLAPMADLRRGGVLARWLGRDWWQRQHPIDRASLLLVAVLMVAGVAVVAAHII